MKTDVTLWLPGAISPYMASVDCQLSALMRLLSRANKQNGVIGLEQTLKSYFCGLSGEIPSGALGALSHGLIAKNVKQTWCLVSPVGCIVTPQTAMLSPLKLQLNHQEITEVSQLLSQHLNKDDLRLTAIAGDEWYCQVSNNVDVVMNDRFDAFYKNMLHYLPSGPHQAYWRRLITECQMLLQTCDVNQKRALRNLPLISSVWFSGLGALPANIKTHFELIYTNESLIKGLALCAACPVEPFESVHNIAFQKKKILIADFELYRELKHQDELAWIQLIKDYENKVFSPLMKAVATNQITTLTLNVNDGYVYHLTKNTLKYFWRKIRPLKNFAKA